MFVLFMAIGIGEFSFEETLTRNYRKGQALCTKQHLAHPELTAVLQNFNLAVSTITRPVTTEPWKAP